MLDDPEIDVWAEPGDYRHPNHVYWRKNYARLSGILSRFRDLALEDSISLYQVQQFQRDLDIAVEYIDERERQARKRLRVAKLRNTDGRTPEETASYLAKADALEHAGRG